MAKIIFFVLCLLGWGVYILNDIGVLHHISEFLDHTLTMFRGFLLEHLQKGGVALAIATVAGGVAIFLPNNKNFEVWKVWLIILATVIGLIGGTQALRL